MSFKEIKNLNSTLELKSDKLYLIHNNSTLEDTLTKYIGSNAKGNQLFNRTEDDKRISLGSTPFNSYRITLVELLKPEELSHTPKSAFEITFYMANGARLRIEKHIPTFERLASAQDLTKNIFSKTMFTHTNFETKLVTILPTKNITYLEIKDLKERKDEE